jgi:hypothetical protein
MIANASNSRTTTWLWAGLSVAACFLSILEAFAVVAGAGTIGVGLPAVGRLRTDLGILLALFALLACGGVLVAARVAFGRWLPVRARDVVVPMVGIGLAIAIELSLHAWVQARYASYDWQMIGLTAGMSFTLIGVAVATLASRIAPRESALPPLLAQGVGATLLVVIVASNVGGLADGIEPASWPLAILLGLGGGYAVLGVGMGIRRVWAG